MATFDLENAIRKGVEKALNSKIDGKSITQWAAIGMKAPQWISVKDRLPDKDGKYLIVWKGTVSYIDIAYFLENLCDNPQFEYEDVPEVPGFYKGDGDGDWIVSGVTHWMPLPSTEGLDET